MRNNSWGKRAERGEQRAGGEYLQVLSIFRGFVRLPLSSKGIVDLQDFQKPELILRDQRGIGQFWGVFE
jgi:hypothetical protein